jgi:hypothetical protein
MTSVAVEPAIPESERLQTHEITGIGLSTKGWDRSWKEN